MVILGPLGLVFVLFLYFKYENNMFSIVKMSCFIFIEYCINRAINKSNQVVQKLAQAPLLKPYSNWTQARFKYL